MDEQIRRLERRAKDGDYQDRAYWKAALERAGHPDPDLAEIQAPLNHFEEVQEDFDEIWWHAKERLRFGWDWEPRGGLVKAHHSWGHRRGHRGENSKRKTLRTHRDGSRRCHKIKNETPNRPPLTEAARRRKKRFGGRIHRGDYQWFGDRFYRVYYEVRFDQ